MTIAIDHARPFAIGGEAFELDSSRVFTIDGGSLEVYEPPEAYCSTLTAAADAGDLTISVASASGLAAGSFLQIEDGEVVIVDSIAGTSLTLLTALVLDHASGDEACEVTTGLPGTVIVFDKAGVQLGLAELDITAAPSRQVNGTGDATFTIPRNAAGIELLGSDRLLLVGDPYGQPWAGSIEPQDWAQSIEQLQVPDLWTLWDTPVTFDEHVADGTPASAVYRRILDVLNAQKTDDGEMRWAFDGTGSQEFLGDLVFEGTAFDGLDFVAGRSRTEFAWRVTVAAGQMVPTLVVRDRFHVAGGVAILDGESGNIISDIRYRKDPTPVRSGVRLIGKTTDIRSLVPDWAQFAVHEVTPDITVTIGLADPTERTRMIEEVQADFGLSRAEQRRLADRTIDYVRQLYASHLYAVHDEDGRPWHPGWAYAGPPDDLAPKLTRDRWATDLRLVEYSGAPASQVMRSSSATQVNLNQRLIVTYDRRTATQTVKAVPSGQVVTGQICTATVSGSIPRYTLGPHTAQPNGTASGSFQVGAAVSAVVDRGGSVNYSFGGQSAYRGTVYLRQAYQARTSPYLRTDNLVGPVLAEGSAFESRQAQMDGSSVAGSTIWLGNAAGDRWLPLPVVRFAAHVYATATMLRLVLSGPSAGYYVASDGLSLSGCVSSESALVTALYTFERQRINLWEPSRDGVGARIARPSVQAGVVTGATRWRRRSWDGGGASTTLLDGIFSFDTTAVVTDASLFPSNVPFIVTIGENPIAEDVRVTAVAGPVWTLFRGLNGTGQHLHEEGETVVLKDAPEWDGLVVDWTWPAGEAEIEALLAERRYDLEQFEITVDPDEVPVELGSVHAVTVTTEGPWPDGPGTRTCRVAGFARDVLEKRTAIILEVEH